ncbi:murein hydrolase activator EnvC [Rhizobiaceae bacterium BDR2-2]|uniref:Murein hydrolase activator EnvC n=1 Tax=Ectorhizobium quercum TaxID=2965071 RepID=A0AAE3N3Y3_9HYPH|nr:murein hydrolase activator EnvC [Ectorhizobium quercum]MCX8999537.1 murein hydrolase activator EnvC [Ectorhizobium quercum]
MIHGARSSIVPRHRRLTATAALALFLAGLFGHPLAAFEPDGVEPGVEAPESPSAELERKRDETRSELETLSKTLDLSADRSQALEDEIARLEKSSQSVRGALIQSATRRKTLEANMLASEKRLAELKVREDHARGSLRERRGLLAEVLGALERMGRNPPPALLVTPEDALGSVRSAILLGAVVPGMRRETERLLADLAALANLQASIAEERADLSRTMSASLEEERRMDLLLTENTRLERENSEQLAEERRRAAELAGRATSLEGLITSLESEIESVRKAAEAARLEEQRRNRLSEAERQKEREAAGAGVPDKNRIAPAYAFSDLKGKLDYPVAGEVLRRFGDADGTGHSSLGMVIASGPEALVTAPADGSVVFAGAFRSFGEMIILNMGDGYHMVLSGMYQVKVRPGRFVFAGEPIAAMGVKRVASAAALALETDRPTLYIELSKDRVPVDSRPWWSATDAGKVRNDS